MVRFHWHVEGGLSAFIAGPQNVAGTDGEEKVYELPCYIELAGQKETFEGLINVRSSYFEEGRVQPVGVALAHDTDVATARGTVIAKLALELAKAGFVVMRCLFNTAAKDVRRFRLYEKSLDALATSPYARTVDRWLLAGLGNGARVAAVVGGRCRGHVAGCCLLSYPLLEPPQPTKAGKASKLGQPAMRPQDSAGPLLKLSCPCMFVLGDRDPVCPAEKLAATQQDMPGTCENTVFPGADQHLAMEQDGTASGEVLEQLCNKVLAFAHHLVELGPAPVAAAPLENGALNSHDPDVDPEPQAEGLDALGSGEALADVAAAATAPAAPASGLQDASAVSIDTAGPDPNETENPAEHAILQADAAGSAEPVSCPQPAAKEDEQMGEAKEPVNVSQPVEHEDEQMGEAAVPAYTLEGPQEQQAATGAAMEA